MEILESLHTEFSVKNKDRSVNSEFVFVYARPRYGKSLAVESLLELYHKAGYTILCLSDVKSKSNSFEAELGYAMFEPEKKYHLDRLKKDGTLPSKKDVILYHPFSFGIPLTKLPKINFFGFSLKDLRRSEFSMISESAWESDTTRLLLNASSNIPKNMGLWGFLHYIKENVVGKKEGKETKHDPNMFDLPITGGTAKSLQDIASYFLPFRKNYFLLPEDSELKLDWEKILNDNKHYHVFGNGFIDDEKLKDFCVMALLELIIRNRSKGKKPILIYIPEIRYLVPYRPEGYKKFLAYSMKSNISTMGNMGKGGITGVFDSQSLTDTDEDVRKSQTKTFFGEMADKDIENISKTLRWGKDQIKPLIQSDTERTSQPSFLYAGDVDRGSWTPRFPSHRHAEESYEFGEVYSEHNKINPEKYPLESYKWLVDKMKKQMEEERAKIKEKIKREQQKKKDEDERKREERGKNKSKKEITEVPKKIQEKLDDNKKRNMELAYKMYNDENIPKRERSVRKIAEKLRIPKSTVAKYVKNYEPEIKTEENPEMSKDELGIFDS